METETDIVIPSEPLTLEGYTALIQQQAKNKKWSVIPRWLQLSVFKEVGEWVACQEKISIQKNVSVQQAIEFIINLIGISKDSIRQQDYTNSDGIEFEGIMIETDFLDIGKTESNKILKETNFEMTDVFCQAGNIQVCFERLKYPEVELVAEMHDIHYFLWQATKVDAPNVNFDTGLINKIKDNNVKKKKTITEDGTMVRR